MLEGNRGTGTAVRPRAAARRVPRQERSRRRVEQILDAASRLVLECGVDALTTRTIAEAAEVPVASLYQYFHDKEDILLALVERDMAEMDAQLLADMAGLDELSLQALVETAMRAFTTVYARRPAFVEIWLRGRTNPAIRERGREHNAEIASSILQFAEAAGLLSRDVPPKIALLAVEVGDRIFQLAYAQDLGGDQELVEEGIRMVSGYLAPYSARDQEALSAPAATAGRGTRRAAPRAQPATPRPASR